MTPKTWGPVMARQPRKTVSEQLEELFDSHTLATEWTAAEMAETLGRNESSIKQNQVYRRLIGEKSEGGIADPDRRVLEAMELLGDWWHTSARIARTVRITQSLCRRRLSALVHLGLADVRRGEFSGYRITAEGTKRLRSKPTRKKRRK